MCRFSPGEEVVCVKDGSDAPNPWYRANPLTKGGHYVILKAVHWTPNPANKKDCLVAVDRSGRLWGEDNFRPVSYEPEVTQRANELILQNTSGKF